MRQKTEPAFILRSVNYKESDRILTLFLKRTGKISAMAKGARKSQRRFGGALEPFSLFDATVVEGKGDMWRLDEARLIVSHEGLARDLRAMSAASFVLELLRELTPENEPQGEVFDLTDDVFSMLERTPPKQAAEVALAAELKLLRLAGMGVSLGHCNACGTVVPKGRPVRFHPSRGGVVCTPCGGGPITLPADAIAALVELDSAPLEDIFQISLPPDVLSMIENGVGEFVEHHLGKSIGMKKY